MKFLSLICLIGLIYTVQAGVYTNTPYEGIVWQAGGTYPINWTDDNKKPSLAELDDLLIELCAGTEKYQHFVATIAKGVKGTTGSVSYTVPKNLGPEGDFYFIKYSQGSNLYYSAQFKITGISGEIPDFDPSNPGKPYTSSAKGATSTAGPTKSSSNTATTSKAKASGSSGPSDSATTKASSTTGSSQPSAGPTVTGGSPINCSYSFLMSFLTIAALIISAAWVY